MTDPNAPCPTLDQLRALLDESLDQAEQITLQQHVDGCEACQKTLESLVAGTESWDAAVGHLRQESLLEEPGLSEAVRRIKQDELEQPSRPEMDPDDFLEPSDQPESIGRLGNYEVSGIIGRGGMGVVMKAYDPTLHRVVAVKVLAPYLAHNPQARKRFIREAQAIAAVSHDHVITIHSIDESAVQPKIIMQYIAGRSLQEKLDAEGSLDLKEILRISLQTAAGLAAAHAQGLVHRDVKPSNILLENGIQRVKLTDFGLARAVDDASLTQSGVIAGTPQYMAPEQANGDAVDFRADLFSLGSVMYAMCVGHSPFRASTTMGVLKRVCNDPPRPIQELNPDVPDWLCAIVMKLLAKSPADRFQSAREVGELLERWLAHVQQPSVAPKPAPIASPTGSDHKPAKVDTASVEEAHVENVYDRTILFQPISGRMLLFFFLTGTAGTMAIIRTHDQDLAELLLLGLVGGMFVAGIGLFVVSLGRFFRANLVNGIAWMRGKEPVVATNTTFSGEATTWHHLPPESLAVLAGIVCLMFRAGPIVAAIIAIIVWRIATAQTKAARTEDAATGPDVPPTSTTKNTGEGVPAFLAGLGRKLQEGMGAAFRTVRRMLSQPLGESHRLPISIAWFLTGGVDLIGGLGLILAAADELSKKGPAGAWPLVVVLGVASLAYSVLSFVTAFCIYFRCYRGLIVFSSFAGVVPLCASWIFRVPLSVLTLFWQQKTVQVT